MITETETTWRTEWVRKFAFWPVEISDDLSNPKKITTIWGEWYYRRTVKYDPSYEYSFDGKTVIGYGWGPFTYDVT